MIVPLTHLLWGQKKFYYQEELRRKDQSGVYDLIFISGKANLSVMTRGFSGALMEILHYLMRV